MIAFDNEDVGAEDFQFCFFINGNLNNLSYWFMDDIKLFIPFALDAEMIEQLNRVIRGTANYFATPWSHCGDMYRSLDRWIRMRLRCMKFKRKSKTDNVRIRLKHFRRMGLLSLSDLRATRIAG